MPDKALASRFGLGIVGSVEYGQVQRIDAFAAIGILVSMGVNARGCVDFAVPGEALSGGFGFGTEGAVKNDQVQGIDTLATIGILVIMGVNT